MKKRSVILFIANLAVGGAGFLLRDYIPVISFLLLYSSIVVFTFFIFALLRLKNRNTIQWVFFFLTISFGTFSFYAAIDPKNILNSLYYSVKLFTFTIEPVFGMKNDPSPSYPFLFEIARWSAILFVISAVISNIYRVTSDTLSLFFLQISGKHVIIAGLNEESVSLAEDLRKKKKRVVMIAEDGSDSSVDRLRESGVSFVFGDVRRENILRKARVSNCSYLIVFKEDDAFNMDVFMTLKSLLEHKRSLFNKNKIKCIIHISDNQYHHVIEAMEEDIMGDEGLRNRLEFRIFNLHEVKAKVLFENHPLYQSDLVDIDDPDSPPVHLLLIGFGRTGQQVLLQAAKLAHFTNGKKLHVSIVDREAEKKEALFMRRYKNIRFVCDLNFYSMEIDDFEFENQVIKNAEYPISNIVICMSNDDLDFVNGILLNENFGDVPVMIKMNNDIHLAEWIHSNNDRFKNIFRFGQTKEVAEADVIIKERLDRLAKAIHENYKDNHEGVGDWETLTVFQKDSNRAQADHMATKLHTMGLYFVSREDRKGSEKVVSYERFEQKLTTYQESLAKAEHERWRAFHYLNGWNVKASFNSSITARDKANKQHAALVSWNQLEPVSNQYQYNFKTPNLNAVKDLYEILTTSGFVICEITKHR